MRHLILDCETAAIGDVDTYLTEPVEAPSNWKDPVKIEQYVKDAKAAQVAKASLDIDLARIVCLGWQLSTDDVPQTALMKDELQEAEMLGRFWHSFWPVYVPGQTVAVTFNGLNFDLPLLLRRSLYLGVTAPKLQLDRYKHIDAIDLMQILCLDGRLKMHGLQFYANRFKIPVEQDITGADIGKAVADGDWAAVERHCAADVQTTYLLAKRMGVL